MYGVWMIVRPYDFECGGGGGGACMSDRVSCSMIKRNLGGLQLKN